MGYRVDGAGGVPDVFQQFSAGCPGCRALLSSSVVNLATNFSIQQSSSPGPQGGPEVLAGVPQPGLCRLRLPSGKDGLRLRLWRSLTGPQSAVCTSLWLASNLSFTVAGWICFSSTSRQGLSSAVDRRLPSPCELFQHGDPPQAVSWALSMAGGLSRSTRRSIVSVGAIDSIQLQ
jgi:hypothetical protein